MGVQQSVLLTHGSPTLPHGPVESEQAEMPDSVVNEANSTANTNRRNTLHLTFAKVDR